MSNVYGDIHYNQERRLIFRNGNQASPVQRVYEPAFLPFFNPVRSGPGRLALNIVLFDPSYGAAAIQAANVADPLTVLLLPITGAVLSLGPRDPTLGPYTSVPARSFAGNNSDVVEVIFDVPANTLEAVKDFAENSSLRVSYGILSQQVIGAQCNISIRAANNSLFSNRINGPVQSGQTGTFSVSVTRNQLADAVSRGWLTLNQSCQQAGGGPAQQLTLARESALRLLPIMLEQLAIQQRPFSQALNELANFSFNGQEAGTRINSYLTSLAQTIQTSASDRVHIAASTEADVLGILGGKASGEFDKQHAESSLNQQDFRYSWTGNQFTPASLNVITIRSGTSSNVASLSAEETTVTGRSNVSRSFIVPIQPQSTSAAWSQTPIGAVIPFFLTPAEAGGLRPAWLPADGSTVNDPFSPLNTRVLPNLLDRVILGASLVTDVNITNDQTQGGTTTLRTDVANIGGDTPVELWTGALSPWIGTIPANTTLADTGGNERWIRHVHRFDLATNYTLRVPLPLPPYRKLIYMVRVR